jgi:amino acid permease (GABA permease)
MNMKYMCSFYFIYTVFGNRRLTMTTEQRQKNLDNAQAVVDSSSLSDEGDRRIIELGYKPVFKREFGRLSSFSFAFSISGLYATIATTFIYGLQAGGAPALVWCWLIAGSGCMCIALSVAELVSAYPTSSGVYSTLKYLVPTKYVPLTSWLCGWLNFLGQVAGVASTDYGCSQLLLATISMGTEFRYQPTARHTVGVMAVIVILHGFINSLSTKWLDRITRWYAIFHLAVLVAASITLLVCQKEKHSPKYVFIEIQPHSGWSPVGFSFLFGFLSVAWVMTGYDATAHISEEIQNAAVRAPQAIASALFLSYILGFLFNIVLAFTMGDIDNLLTSPTAQPFAQIFYNVLGATGGIIFTLFAFIVLNFCGIAALQANARTIFAFSRDELLPFSKVWIRINSYTQTPLIAVWLNVIVAIGINLIGLGSYTAIVAIFNVCAIALDWSYCIPIICKLIYGTETGRYIPGPWNLGKFSTPINCWSVIWTLFVSTIFLMPTTRPVTAENMNYAVVILIGILTFAMIYWYVGGARKHYIGPRTQYQEQKEKDNIEAFLYVP